MKTLYDNISYDISKTITKNYSTSFSLAILPLPRKKRNAIYAIYGFVRLADEIVDTFHEYDKNQLLDEFEADTYKALERKISLNPVLNSFQSVVHEYSIPRDVINSFLFSMRMDLDTKTHDEKSYQKYIYGSAEVVGLMCLKIFVDGNEAQYNALVPTAQKLGAAFQKVNFLRDLKYDNQQLSRQYFPGLESDRLSKTELKDIYDDIERDFNEAYTGIVALPRSCRCAVYIAYKYYLRLFDKIKRMDTQKAYENRIRIPNILKLRIFLGSYLKHQFNVL